MNANDIKDYARRDWAGIAALDQSYWSERYRKHGPGAGWQAAAALRWYVSGAQAAIFYGSARLTADVDVTVLRGEHPLDELPDSLQEAGFEARTGRSRVSLANAGITGGAHAITGA